MLESGRYGSPSQIEQVNCRHRRLFIRPGMSEWHLGESPLASENGRSDLVANELNDLHGLAASLYFAVSFPLSVVLRSTPPRAE